MDTCACESSLCSHGEDPCDSRATRPAPVRWLDGAPMCEGCIRHYVDAGYGIADSAYATERDGEFVVLEYDADDSLIASRTFRTLQAAQSYSMTERANRRARTVTVTVRDGVRIATH